MYTRQIEDPFNQIEDSQEELISDSIIKIEQKEYVYPKHDVDLEEEFDAIRSVN